MTAGGSRALLRAVPAPEQQETLTLLAFAASAGLRPPRWVTRVLDPATDAWVAERWDESSMTFTWAAADRVTMNKAATGRGVPLSGLSPLVQLEMLVHIGADHAESLSALPPATRAFSTAAELSGATSVAAVPTDDLAQLPLVLARRWNHRADLYNGNPDDEWNRDKVRIAVVRPDAPKRRHFNLGAITQPWLRDLLVDVLKVRLTSTSVNALAHWNLTIVRLSEFLATRQDGGLNPSVLTGAVIDRWVRALNVDPDTTDQQVYGYMKDLSAVLTQARAMGFTDRHRLPASFAPRPDHRPAMTKTVRDDRGFPEATFRFLMGSDDLLGARVFDLARTVARDDFFGQVFVTALQLAGNFGRRPEELCALKIDRVRSDDHGRAELLYDNFKSGRDRVWLPIDSRSATLIRDWAQVVRKRYPDTALSEIALLPGVNKNPRGTTSIGSPTLASWFRIWVQLLEQAIVLAHLRAATGLSIKRLTQLRYSDLDGANAIVVDEHTYALPEAIGAAFVDYYTPVRQRMSASKRHTDHASALPVFPDPMTQPGGQAAGSLDRFMPVLPERFGALGQDWDTVAAHYACIGIPGHNLGNSRIDSAELQVRLFRHTYLQQLVNIGTDIFIVQELADHANVQTTINSYVRVQDQKLREAVDRLAEHRLTTTARAPIQTLQITSQPARDVGTNQCTNPQVLALGNEGCDHDRMCFGCEHLAADPSNIPDLKAEIQTCNLTIARVEAEDLTDLRQHHVAVLRARRDGWQRVLRMLTRHLDSLNAAERERVETAASIVRNFRNRVRSGGLNLGGNGLAQ